MAADSLVEEMIRRWQAGERAYAEEFLQRDEQVGGDADAAMALIYEEVCQRQELGETVTAEDVVARFPQWRPQVQMLLNCHRLLDTPPAPEMPAVGASFGEFTLLAELGRGALGRVYLAAQPTLANRLVALKMTPCTGREHWTLARLQHTNIMPLYAAHDDPERNLRTLVMPYFGGAALADVLKELQDTPIADRTGHHLLGALDRAAKRPAGAPSAPAAVGGPIRQLFAQASYVEAVCWIGACLADALQYAHERGLVHLDLKPSNILLAADGQPMLLDFHIARQPIPQGSASPDAIGGTPLYMSPEQQAAMSAVQEGVPIREGVDGRSDIYSLGLVLREALQGNSDQRALQVSVGLADIIGKCLRPEARDRYATAAALAADLRRHLHDLPLQGVRNRSLFERWQKWRRRRPYVIRLGLMGGAVLAAALAMGLFGFHQVGQQRRAAESALASGQQQFNKRSYAQAVESLAHGLALAENLPGGADLTVKLQRQMQPARRALAAEQLHVLVERLRYLCGAPSLPASEGPRLASRWQAVWDQRGWLKDRRRAELEPAMEERLDADLFDLGVLWADLRVRQAEPRANAHQEALQILAETEALFGPSHILCRQRQSYAEALGQAEVAQEAGRRAATLPAHTAWEHCAVGRLHLQAGELEQAARSLNQAVELMPHGFWPNFYQGVCAYRQKRAADAAAAFRVCIALAPESAEAYCNRALANLELGRGDLALPDFNRALQLEPRLAPAALNRGLLHFAHKRHREAIADLQHALACGSEPASVRYHLAWIHLDLNDRDAANASLKQALQADPEHQSSRILLERLSRP